MTGRNPRDDAVDRYRQCKDKVCDAAAVWHAWNEPRRADRMTAEEVEDEAGGDGVD